MKRLLTSCLAAAMFLPMAAQAGSFLDQIAQRLPVAAATASAGGTIEVAFSPRGGAQDLVIKVIDASRSSIHMLAYSFTSAPITEALLRARKRGVEVYLVADHDHNLGTDRSGKPRAAMNALVNAGARVRTTNAFKIHHDKSIVSDRMHVQLGSFNYSASAETSNSENVLVQWNNRELADVFLKHFERNWQSGADYRAGY